MSQLSDAQSDVNVLRRAARRRNPEAILDTDGYYKIWDAELEEEGIGLTPEEALGDFIGDAVDTYLELSEGTPLGRDMQKLLGRHIKLIDEQRQFESAQSAVPADPS